MDIFLVEGEVLLSLCSQTDWMYCHRTIISPDTPQSFINVTASTEFLKIQGHFLASAGQ